MSETRFQNFTVIHRSSRKFRGRIYHDINFNSVKTRVALKFVIILQNLIKTNYRKSGKSEYDRKLTELDVR